MEKPVKCKGCGQKYDCYDGNFYKHKTNKTGYNGKCIQCSKNYYNNDYRNVNALKIKIKNAVYFAKNYVPKNKPLTFKEQQKQDRDHYKRKKKLINYSRKFRWQEEPFIINDISPEEL